MQSIPVDMARLGPALCVVPPEPRVNKETGEIRKNRDGDPVWVIGLAIRQKNTRRTDMIEVAVSGEPEGLTEGMRVSVVDLVAVSWEIDGRKGTSFRASAVRPESAAPPPAAGAGGRAAKSGGGAQ
ncbi:hypothetical protein ACIBCM_27765 [Streptomyces sp. NPDC051018]|uniref:SCO3933 family regulatory protein n=1 Tax=Streptomyces sp. NPDC051018 TaxID=3365639 RepID=UPI0037B47E15